MAKDNLKQTIIENAAELFSTNGYAATSLKQIAAASGCKAPSLYYFFEGGKIELFHEVINQLFTDVFSGIDRIEADSLEDFLRKFTNYYGSIVPDGQIDLW